MTRKLRKQVQRVRAKRRSTTGPEVCLISTPWLPYNQPAMSIAALQASLVRAGVGCQAIHSHALYADAIGYDAHQALMNLNPEPGNMLFGVLLHDTAKNHGRLRMMLREQERRHGMRMSKPETLLRHLRLTTDRLVAMIAPSATLVGISVGISGIPAAIYIAERIRRRRKDVRIVIGGAVLDAAIGRALVDGYSQFDYFILGEGEKPLLSLVQSFRAGRPAPDGVPPLYWRGRSEPLALLQVEDINVLPIPDFDDYFDLLKRLTTDIRANVILPVEGARGCWWGSAGTGRGGCSFCGMHQMWKAYRFKSPARMAREIRYYAGRYQVLNFQFGDSAQPPKSSELTKRFDAIARLGLDLRLVVNVRANLVAKDAAMLRRSGVRAVCLGVEALDDEILKVMNKGTTLYQNLRTMKALLENDISVEGNIIFNHPGCRPRDIRRSAKALRAIAHFPPLSFSAFKLDRRSDVCLHPEDYGVHKLRPPRAFQAIFGRERAGAFATEFLWTGEGRAALKAWDDFIRLWSLWKRVYESRDPRRELTLLTWRHGVDGIQVEDRRGAEETIVHLLRGPLSDVFLAFRDGGTFAGVAAQLGMQQRQLSCCVEELARLGIVYADGTCALSLPMRWNRLRWRKGV